MLAPTLIGDRITLQQITLPEMLHSRKWGRNRRVQRFITVDFGHATDAEQIKFWRQTRRNPSEMMFSIYENSTARHIGNCGIHHFDPTNSHAELGILIGEEKSHSKGLGTETVTVLRDYAFRELKLNRLSLEVFSHNSRAIRCYEKAGFKPEGTLRAQYKKGKKFIDVHVMSMLRSEWKTLTNNGKSLSYTHPKN